MSLSLARLAHVNFFAANPYCLMCLLSK